MYSAKIKVYCFVGLLAGLLLIFGCGSSDGLDAEGGTFTFNLTAQDGGDDNTHDIDVVQIADCDGDLTTVDPELFTGTQGDITISVSSGSATGIEVESFRVDYLPEASPLPTSGTFTPPSLASITVGNTFYAGIGLTTTDNFTLMSTGTKDAYVTAMVASGLFDASGPYEGLYTIALTIYYRYDSDDPDDTPRSRTIYYDVSLLNWDRCD